MRISPISTVLFLTAAAGLTTVVLVDHFHFGTGFIHEGPPLLTPGYLARSAVIAGCAVLLFMGFLKVRRETGGVGELALTQGHRIGALVIMGCSLVFSSVLMAAPDLFSALAREDGPVETLSVVFLLLASGLTGLALLRDRRRLSRTACWALAGLAVLFFVIAMEELSWMQRVFDFRAIGILPGNLQRETNLHNFATNAFENAYYFGAFLFLVGFPFLRFALGPAWRPDWRVFLPGPAVAVPGAIACAYTFDMWNIVPIQFAFFAAMLVLGLFAYASGRRTDRILFGAALLLCLSTQWLFLYSGDRFLRLWDVTEYREFFIPAGFLLYAVDLFWPLDRQGGGR